MKSLHLSWAYCVVLLDPWIHLLNFSKMSLFQKHFSNKKYLDFYSRNTQNLLFMIYFMMGLTASIQLLLFISGTFWHIYWEHFPLNVFWEILTVPVIRLLPFGTQLLSPAVQLLVSRILINTLNKMSDILQITFSNAFSWMKSFIFPSKFH